jgi:hypothetical protein
MSRRSDVLRVVAVILAVAVGALLGMPASALAAGGSGYDRGAASAFMAKHWNDPPRIRLTVLGITLKQADDCAYFASEVLWAGGLRQTATWSADSKDVAELSSPRLADPGPTKTVMLADRLEKYLVATGQATVRRIPFTSATIAGAEVGDLVVYDWNDNGVIDHVSVVQSTKHGTRIAQHNVNLRSESWRWSSTSGTYIADAYAHPRAWLVHVTV